MRPCFTPADQSSGRCAFVANRKFAVRRISSAGQHFRQTGTKGCAQGGHRLVSGWVRANRESRKGSRHDTSAHLCKNGHASEQKVVSQFARRNSPAVPPLAGPRAERSVLVPARACFRAVCRVTNWPAAARVWAALRFPHSRVGRARHRPARLCASHATCYGNPTLRTRSKVCVRRAEEGCCLLPDLAGAVVSEMASCVTSGTLAVL